MGKSTDNKNKKWIPFLMVVSQVILCIFVIYWLVEQYNKEKETLRKELVGQYFQAQEQVIDSLLLKHIISPALGDTTEFDIKLSSDSARVFVNHDTINHAYATYYKNDTDKEKKIISIEVQNFSDSQFHNLDTVDILKIKKEDALKRSVKMIIHQTEKSSLIDDTSNFIFPGSIDGELFKKIFRGSIEENEHNFGLEWYTKSDSVVAIKTDFLVNTNFTDNLPAVSISKYSPYLFGKIWPQIVFAFLLLSLTASAFLFTYKSLKQQLQLNTLRNEFISNITHELKTPVSTAKVALEALQTFDMKKDTKTAEKYLEMVSAEMNRLDKLTSMVLTHSKLESQGDIITKEKINLFEFVENVLSEMKPRFQQFNAVVSFNEHNKDLMLEMDKFYIEGVLINLLDNSMKYSEPNPQIEVKTMQKNDNVYLSVSDNGPGIPEEYLSKVFDKFFRVPTGNKHNVKGYGLGLSFALMVMKQHKGEIMVENLAKGGCMFTLKFPI